MLMIIFIRKYIRMDMCLVCFQEDLNFLMCREYFFHSMDTSQYMVLWNFYKFHVKCLRLFLLALMLLYYP